MNAETVYAESLINSDDQLLIAAEREVAAFLIAVARLTDGQFVERAAQYWMDALNRMNWHCEMTEGCWRRISIAAASQLASIGVLSRDLSGHPARSVPFGTLLAQSA